MHTSLPANASGAASLMDVRRGLNRDLEIVDMGHSREVEASAVVRGREH